MSISILTGDCRNVLRTLPDESVHCVVTSPPYWGLRDYGTAIWEGGDPTCEHKVRENQSIATSTLGGGKSTISHAHEGFKNECPRCGARRIDSQLGLEPSYTDYVSEMVAVFREVRRVLRPDGTLWLNLGDSYASSPPGNTTKGVSAKSTLNGVNGTSGEYRETLSQSVQTKRNTVGGGLKPKDLCGIPWRVAFALQADGWYLRSDIIWSKPNPMPESVTDRPTKAHEYLFLMARSERYYYDAEAIKEPQSEGTFERYKEGEVIPSFNKEGGSSRKTQQFAASTPIAILPGGVRNRRTVWEIPTAPFPEAHFATFPPALIEPCIMAGCPERCCAKCGMPWVRQMSAYSGEAYEKPVRHDGRPDGAERRKIGGGQKEWDSYIPPKTIGWSPSCACDAGTMPGTVLDPFGGAGTTGLVADRLGRNAILIELNPEYAEMAKKRIAGDAGMFAEIGDGYDAHKDVEGSFNEAYRVIRERVAAGGPGWTPRCDKTGDLFGEEPK